MSYKEVRKLHSMCKKVSKEVQKVNEKIDSDTITHKLHKAWYQSEAKGLDHDLVINIFDQLCEDLSENLQYFIQTGWKEEDKKLDRICPADYEYRFIKANYLCVTESRSPEISISDNLYGDAESRLTYGLGLLYNVEQKFNKSIYAKYKEYVYDLDELKQVIKEDMDILYTIMENVVAIDKTVTKINKLIEGSYEMYQNELNEYMGERLMDIITDLEKSNRTKEFEIARSIDSKVELLELRLQTLNDNIPDTKVYDTLDFSLVEEYVHNNIKDLDRERLFKNIRNYIIKEWLYNRDLRRMSIQFDPNNTLPMHISSSFIKFENNKYRLNAFVIHCIEFCRLCKTNEGLYELRQKYVETNGMFDAEDYVAKMEIKYQYLIRTINTMEFLINAPRFFSYIASDKENNLEHAKKYERIYIKA